MQVRQTFSSLYRVRTVVVFFVGLLLVASALAAQQFPPADSTSAPPQLNLPPLEITVADVPDDHGGQLRITWTDPGYENLPGFEGFQVTRHEVRSDSILVIGTAPFGARELTDDNAVGETEFVYRVAAIVNGVAYPSAESPPAWPTVQWFNWSKISVVVIGLIVCGAVIYFIETAKRGKKLFLRRIAGLEAIDEAVGRATEMGRPVLFVAGTQDMDDVQTLAGLTILGRVARTIAQYDSQINMPCRASLVMTAGREIIKEAYSTAGRPDAYSDDMVHYTTDEQFGYVAAVNGIMVRQKPATCFYLGAFFAESLILAETGNSIEAIQIAGTAMPAQLPFFVAACDYTLIGEELFAASAYLSEEPKQLGSLKGQDVGKAIALAAIFVGVVAATIGQAWDIGFMKSLEELLHRMFSIS